MLFYVDADDMVEATVRGARSITIYTLKSPERECHKQ